jgi:hypothetical protein
MVPGPALRLGLCASLPSVAVPAPPQGRAPARGPEPGTSGWTELRLLKELDRLRKSKSRDGFQAFLRHMDFTWIRCSRWETAYLSRKRS